MIVSAMTGKNGASKQGARSTSVGKGDDDLEEYYDCHPRGHEVANEMSRKYKEDPAVGPYTSRSQPRKVRLIPLLKAKLVIIDLRRGQLRQRRSTARSSKSRRARRQVLANETFFPQVARLAMGSMSYVCSGEGTFMCAVRPGQGLLL